MVFWEWWGILPSPLSDLTRKGEPGPMDPESQTGLPKTTLTCSLVLRSPNFDLPFLVHSGALETGLGTVLLHIFNSEEHLIIIISWKLMLAKRQAWSLTTAGMELGGCSELHPTPLNKQAPFTMLQCCSSRAERTAPLPTLAGVHSVGPWMSLYIKLLYTQEGLKCLFK